MKGSQHHTQAPALPSTTAMSCGSRGSSPYLTISRCADAFADNGGFVNPSLANLLPVTNPCPGAIGLTHGRKLNSYHGMLESLQHAQQGRRMAMGLAPCAITDIPCWQVDELQTQLQKKLLGSSPPPSSKARSSAAAAVPTASNAVTYSGAIRGASGGGYGSGFICSDDAAEGEQQSSEAGLGREQHAAGSGSASHGSYGVCSRFDYDANPSNGDGSPEMSGGSHEHGGHPGDDAGWNPEYHGSATAEPDRWQDGIALSPARAGTYSGYRQRTAVRPSARAAAASAALTELPIRAVAALWRDLKQRPAVVHVGGVSRRRDPQSCGPPRVGPRATPLRSASGYRFVA